jgi:hypothetical protein
MTVQTMANRKTALVLAAGLLGLAVALPGAAEARGFVSFGFSAPLGPPAYYYPPPAYYPPPPAYYPPAPAYYYPPPAYYAPPQGYAPPAAPSAGQGGNCREYQSTTTIDGRKQPTYGTACLQPDGSWRIVR